MRIYSSGHPLVFCHIPKSAGTSLSGALVQVLRPERLVVGADLSLVGGYQLDDLGATIGSGVIAAPQDLPADASLVAGHFSPGSTMQRFPDADHITTLRNPRSRVVSQWFHSRSLSEFDLRHWGTLAIAARLARLPFAEHLQQAMIAPNVDNTITRFLTWPHPLVQPSGFIDERHDDELFAAAMDRLDRFAHVDVVENPTFMSELGLWLGSDLRDTRANERLSVPRNRRCDLGTELSASTVDLLDHRTRIDQRIWSTVVRDSLDDDPATLMKSSWEATIDRYEAAMQRRGEFRLARHVAVGLYELRARVRP